MYTLINLHLVVENLVQSESSVQYAAEWGDIISILTYTDR